MNTDIKRVCVYAASSGEIRPIFFEETALLAKDLAHHNITAVYGGGGTGLMGQLATTMLEHNGHVVGIMPHFMKEVEWAHKQVKEFVFVADMHERKKRFMEGVDALIALPGGVGTMEELFEAITWKKLGLFNKPIIIVNTDHFYDPLVDLLQKMVDEKFVGQLHTRMWKVVTKAEEVVPAIINADPWIHDAIKMAADYKAK
ncbi:MAG: TIGR00730 family Rossman fold protein [Flavobacteriales bacterium]